MASHVFDSLLIAVSFLFITEGSQVVVFGIGCIGLSVLQGAREKKCPKIIAVDVNSGKAELAKKFGATDFVNPKDLPKGQTIVEKIIEMTDGGADFTFDATGNVQVMRDALECCHKGESHAPVPSSLSLTTVP